MDYYEFFYFFLRPLSFSLLPHHPYNRIYSELCECLKQGLVESNSISSFRALVCFAALGKQQDRAEIQVCYL